MRISDWSSDVCSSDLVTITGTVDRGIKETGVNGATGYLATNMTLRADYELLRNLIISAGGELEKRDFNNIDRSEEHTSELQSLMRNSYAVFCLKQKNTQNTSNTKDKNHTMITKT